MCLYRQVFNHSNADTDAVTQDSSRKLVLIKHRSFRVLQVLNYLGTSIISGVCNVVPVALKK